MTSYLARSTQRKARNQGKKNSRQDFRGHKERTNKYS